MKQDVISLPTLSPQEAVRLSQQRTINDIIIVKDIYEAYDNENHQIRESQPFWYTLSLLSTCWNAGRIEGVRMERARRKADKKTAVIERTVCLGRVQDQNEETVNTTTTPQEN